MTILGYPLKKNIYYNRFYLKATIQSNVIQYEFLKKIVSSTIGKRKTVQNMGNILFRGGKIVCILNK